MNRWVLLGVFGIMIVVVFWFFVYSELNSPILESKEFRIMNANGYSWNLLDSENKDYLGGNDYREIKETLDSFGIKYEDSFRKLSRDDASLIHAEGNNISIVFFKFSEDLKYDVILVNYSGVEFWNVYANDLHEWFVPFESEGKFYFWHFDSNKQETVLGLDDDIKGSLYSDDIGNWYLVDRRDGYDGVYFFENDSFLELEGIEFDDMRNGVFRTRLFSSNEGEWYLSIEPYTGEMRNYDILTYEIKGAKAHAVRGLPEGVSGIRYWYGEKGEWIAEIKYCSGDFSLFPCDFRAIFNNKDYYYVNNTETKKLGMNSFYEGGFETCVSDCVLH